MVEKKKRKYSNHAHVIFKSFSDAATMLANMLARKALKKPAS